jgi:hypothetical protein
MDESVFIKYKTEEERLEALRKMVGRQNEFEAHVHELMEKRNQSNGFTSI